MHIEEREGYTMFFPFVDSEKDTPFSPSVVAYPDQARVRFSGYTFTIKQTRALVEAFRGALRVVEEEPCPPKQ